MKTLMLGNEAVARGLYEGGCSFVSSYPGTPSTEITECAAKYEELYAEWAPNEKVALEAAFGACLSGKRSFCAMKHVGLNVAADPLFTISYTGVHAGLVIGVADDAGMHSSQNEQDSRHYAQASRIPMLEPSDSAEALAFAKLAYELSEEFDTAVLLKMCTRVSHSQSVVETGERVLPAQKKYEKNPGKYIMMPANAKKRHPEVEVRTKALTAWAETTEINRIETGSDPSCGIITSSTCYQYVKEAFGLPVRVNTNGQGSLICGRDIAPECAGLVDAVSISLNTPNPERYAELTRSRFGEAAFPAMLDFAREVKRYVPSVTMTTVETTLTPEEEDACRAICEDLGVNYRIRLWVEEGKVTK